jgi:hypothetical protein
VREHLIGRGSTGNVTTLKELADIDRHTCLQSHLQTSPRTSQNSYPKFRNYENTPLCPPNYSIVRGGRRGPQFCLGCGILIFLNLVILLVEFGYMAVETCYMAVESGYMAVESGYMAVESGCRAVEYGYMVVESGYRLCQKYWPPKC